MSKYSTFWQFSSTAYIPLKPTLEQYEREREKAKIARIDNCLLSSFMENKISPFQFDVSN